MDRLKEIVGLAEERELLAITAMPAMVMILLDFLSLRSRFLEETLVVAAYYVAIMFPGSILIKAMSAVAALLLARLLFRRRTGKEQSAEKQIEGSLDLYRSTVIIMVSICTFACDFAQFPARFMKTKMYGASLMDSGVFMFVINAGILASRKERKFSPKKSLVLFVLGLTRMALIMSGYYADPTEYGTHMNFYFVFLASEIFFHCFKSFPPLSTGLGILFLHEIVLNTTSLPDLIFSDNRSNLLLANKEGILAVVPYTSVYLISKGIGKRVFADTISGTTRVRRMAASALFFYVGYIISASISPPSRRLGNLSISLLIILANLLPGIAVVFALNRGVEMKDRMKRISRTMGSLFLISNLFILIGNLTFTWKGYGSTGVHVANSIYLVCTFFSPLAPTLQKLLF
jgi:glucosaminylphosphatidylinositol acyltransferase